MANKRYQMLIIPTDPKLNAPPNARTVLRLYDNGHYMGSTAFGDVANVTLKARLLLHRLDIGQEEVAWLPTVPARITKVSDYADELNSPIEPPPCGEQQVLSVAASAVHGPTEWYKLVDQDAAQKVIQRADVLDGRTVNKVGLEVVSRKRAYQLLADGQYVAAEAYSAGVRGSDGLLLPPGRYCIVCTKV